MGSQRRSVPRKAPAERKRRRSRAFLDALRRQCRLANEADRRDNWRQFLRAQYLEAAKDPARERDAVTWVEGLKKPD